jgi:hypothetical protein
LRPDGVIPIADLVPDANPSLAWPGSATRSPANGFRPMLIFGCGFKNFLVCLLADCLSVTGTFAHALCGVDLELVAGHLISFKAFSYCDGDLAFRRFKPWVTAPTRM